MRIAMASFLLAAGPAAAQDMREPAGRTAAERAFILGQMRLFLGSVQAITAALPAGDMKTVAAEAAARGRRGTPASAIPPAMKAKETASWTAMMGGARKGFDDIAAAAESGVPPLQVLGQLGETMRNCVACHQTYRLVEEPGE
jgi:hypothetical protein